MARRHNRRRDGHNDAMKQTVITVVGAVLLACAAPVAAQSGGRAFELGGQVVSARVHEFDRRDTGAGVRFGWHPFSTLGVESEFNWYPGDFPGVRPFSASRVEGLVGATIGPTLGRLRPFLRFRGGFMRFGAASEPIACIAIFPPPLSCVLGAGSTLPAFDVGGGLEYRTTPRTFLRVDVGDRVLKYPGPAFSRSGVAHEGAFYSHDLRLAAGAGWRF